MAPRCCRAKAASAPGRINAACAVILVLVAGHHVFTSTRRLAHTRTTAALAAAGATLPTASPHTGAHDAVAAEAAPHGNAKVTRAPSASSARTSPGSWKAARARLPDQRLPAPHTPEFEKLCGGHLLGPRTPRSESGANTLAEYAALHRKAMAGNGNGVRHVVVSEGRRSQGISDWIDIVAAGLMAAMEMRPPAAFLLWVSNPCACVTHDAAQQLAAQNSEHICC